MLGIKQIIYFLQLLQIRNQEKLWDHDMCQAFSGKVRQSKERSVKAVFHADDNDNALKLEEKKRSYAL